MDAGRYLRDSFYRGFHTCFPTAPDRNLVEVGMGRTWAEAGTDDAIVKDLDAVTETPSRVA